MLHLLGAGMLSGLLARQKPELWTVAASCKDSIESVPTKRKVISIIPGDKHHIFYYNT
jgi:hypothetical protein